MFSKKMDGSSIISLTVCLMILVLAIAPSFTAIAGQDNPPHIKDKLSDGKSYKGVVKPESRLSSILEQINNAGSDAGKIWASLSLKDRESVFKYLEPDLYAQGIRGELASVDFVPAPDSVNESEKGQGTVSPQWCTGYYLVNSSYRGDQYVSAAYVEGWGPANLSLQSTRSVSNSFSANVGVSASVVSAGVGFSVTASQSWNYGYSIAVPARQKWAIRAYNIFKQYRFDIWNDSCFSGRYYVGNGLANKFTGVSYSQWRLQ